MAKQMILVPDIGDSIVGFPIPVDYRIELGGLPLFVHLDYLGILGRKIKRKRCDVLVSHY